MKIRILGPGDLDVLENVSVGVFDREIDPKLAAEFLGDSRHHIAVAVEDGSVAGFASAVHYVHPDKPAELWIDEVGVAPTHRNRGIGTGLLRALLDLGRELGCREAWVLTDRDNSAAMRLYAGAGGIEAPKDQVMFTFRIAP